MLSISLFGFTQFMRIPIFFGSTGQKSISKQNLLLALCQLLLPVSIFLAVCQLSLSVCQSFHLALIVLVQFPHCLLVVNQLRVQTLQLRAAITMSLDSWELTTIIQLSNYSINSLFISQCTINYMSNLTSLQLLTAVS